MKRPKPRENDMDDAAAWTDPDHPAVEYAHAMGKYANYLEAEAQRLREEIGRHAAKCAKTIKESEARVEEAERNEGFALDDARGFLPDEVSLTCAQEAVHILAGERDAATERAKEANRVALECRSRWGAAEARAEEAERLEQWRETDDENDRLAHALRETRQRLREERRHGPGHEEMRALEFERERLADALRSLVVHLGWEQPGWLDGSGPEWTRPIVAALAPHTEDTPE